MIKRPFFWRTSYLRYIRKQKSMYKYFRNYIKAQSYIIWFGKQFIWCKRNLAMHVTLSKILLCYFVVRKTCKIKNTRSPKIFLRVLLLLVSGFNKPQILVLFRRSTNDTIILYYRGEDVVNSKSIVFNGQHNEYNT